MKKNKFLLFIISLLCFFGFKLNAKAFNNIVVDNGVVVSSNFMPNNQTNDSYNFNISNADFNGTVKLYYKDDGVYIDTPIQQNLKIYDEPNFKQHTWIFFYFPFYHVMRFDFVNQSCGVGLSNAYYQRNVFDFETNNFGISCRGSFNKKTYVEFNTSWNVGSWSSSSSSSTLGGIGYQQFLYGSNSAVNYFYNSSSTSYYKTSTVQSSISVLLSNLTPVKDKFNNIIKYNVNVSFSTYDTNYYKYQYCLDNVCQDILANNINLELYQNGSYIFQILDNNDELIDSTSLTISNINVETPFIDYSLSVPDSCVAFIDNVSRNMCKSLKIEWGTSNPNYIYQYSINNLDFENIYGSYSLLLVQNDSVILRVIDNDNNILWSNTITVNDLYTIDSSLGIFTTFNQTNFGKNESVSNYLEIYIYNLDLNYIDNVYISYDGFNFTKLDVLNRGTFFYALSKAIYSSQQVYINIKNNNNEVIYSTSYYVDMSKVANNGLLSYLENFNMGMTGPISTFVTTPIRFFQNILNNSSVCTSLVLPSPIGNLSLPCMKTVYTSISLDLYNIIETIFSGILIYYCCLNIIKTLKSLVSPTDDRIEVVDL